MTDAKPDIPDAETSPFLHKWPRRIEGSRMLHLWIELDGKKREALLPPQSCLLVKVHNRCTRIDLPNGGKAFLFLPLNEAYDAIYHENPANPINDLRSSTALASGTVHDGDIYLGEDKDYFWFVEKANALEQDHTQAQIRAQSLRTTDKYWSLPHKEILKMMFNQRAAGAFAGTYDDSRLFYLTSTKGYNFKFGKYHLEEVGYDPNKKGESRLVYSIPKI